LHYKAYFHKAAHWLRTSRLFALQANSKRIFFPGCSLTSGSPELVSDVFAHLRKSDPEIGIQLDCCGMPLTKFVGKGAAIKTHKRLADSMQQTGATEIITACGNCFIELSSVMKQANGPCVTSLYDVLATTTPPQAEAKGSTLFHHPCPARVNNEFRKSFEQLAAKISFVPESPDERGQHALACCLHKTPLAKSLRTTVRDSGARVLTYCAHCVKEFQNDLPVTHILEHLFGHTRRLRRRSIAGKWLAYLSAKKNCATVLRKP
jgi:hypothetical protein